MVKLNWEKITDFEYRAKVHNGWIVAFRNPDGIVTATCFVPDPDHTGWQDMKEMILQMTKSVIDEKIEKVIPGVNSYDIVISGDKYTVPKNVFTKKPEPGITIKEALYPEIKHKSDPNEN